MTRSVAKTASILLISGAAVGAAPWAAFDHFGTDVLRPWTTLMGPARAAADDGAGAEPEALAAPELFPPADHDSLPIAPPTVDDSEAIDVSEPAESAAIPDAEAPQLQETESQPAEGNEFDTALTGEASFPRSVMPEAPGDDPATPTVGEAERRTALSTVMLEWVAPRSINRGQQAEFRLVVRNTMKQAAKNVAVHFQMPEHAELGECTPRPTSADGVLLWKLGQLAAGATRTIEIALTPTERGEIEPQAAVTFTRAASTRVAIVEPELALEIDGAPQAVVGQRGQCALIVHNHGSGAATGVVVRAHLPEELATSDELTTTYQLGTLPAGQSRRIEFDLMARELGEHLLQFEAACAGTAAKSVNHQYTIVQPTVQLSIAGPKKRYVERQASYVIQLENPGPAPINNIQVVENVPDGFRFVEATAGGDYNSEARQVAWFVGRLEPNASTSVEVRLLPTAAGDHAVSAEVTAEAGVSAKAATTTRVEGIAAVVLEVVDRDDPIEVAGDTLYEIRITNQGSEPARDVQVAAALPAEMEALSIDGPSDGTIDGDKIVFEPIATLGAGATETFSVHVRCHGEGNVRFRAYFRTDDSTTPVMEEELTRIYAD